MCSCQNKSRLFSLPDCNRTVTDLNGTVTSPYYTSTHTYLPNMLCVTTFDLPPSFRIRIYIRHLNFSDLRTGACSDGDFLYFRDLISLTETKISCKTDTGSANPIFESSGSKIQMTFASDQAYQGAGFEIQYIGIPSCQNETSSRPSGSFSSVNFPHQYANMQECFYTINTDTQDTVIELNFEAFITESSLSNDERLRDTLCTRDYVEIFDGPERLKVCGNWSGKEHLLLFRSRSNAMVFRY